MEQNADSVLFDLDGTLTDSEPGIVHSVRYALRSFGMEAEPATLRSFIGPPLYDSFRGTMGMSDADAKRAVDTYRVYFRDKGIFENAPYPGVPEMLEALRAAGRRLIVATSRSISGLRGRWRAYTARIWKGNVPPKST